MSSAMGTENIRMIRDVFAENGLLEVAVKQLFSVTSVVLQNCARVNSGAFFTHFRRFSNRDT